MSCLFCDFASGAIPVDLLFSSDTVFAISDINPQAPTHILVIPRLHVENAIELAQSAPDVLAELFLTAQNLVAESELSGYRMVFNTGQSAGQSVFHAHLHLLGGRPFAWPPG
jgi:histidine triad (HIT) family protein